MAHLTSIGRALVALAFMAFGALHLIYGDFVTRVVPMWPEWMPFRTATAWIIGVAMAAASAAILTHIRTVTVAFWLGVLVLVSFGLISVPLAATDAPFGGLWTVAGKTLALSGGAFLVARSALDQREAGGGPAARPERSRRERSRRAARVEGASSLAPWFFGAFLVLCGIQHFIHVAFVTTLVPTWIPGALFWTYFAGVALIAGGIGVVLPATARLAGLLTAGMIFTWVIVLHIPRAAVEVDGANETVAVFEAIAMTGIALLIAAGAARRAQD